MNAASEPVRRIDALIVGGGLFGCWLALGLRRDHGLSVAIVERQDEILRRASYNNQARVHNGYHYPRSILTGLRSRVNSGRFLEEYADCVDTSFTKLYAVPRQRSNVTGAQFEAFCRRIGAALRPPDPRHLSLFDMDRIEAVWEVDEWAFDSDKLARRLRGELDAAGVPILLGVDVERVRPGAAGRPRLVAEARARGGERLEFAADHVFNCTYAELNGLLWRSGLKRLPLKIELAEMALVEVPPAFRKVGVTVMCGPFFSFMPFPPLGLHTLSHVRYTPHHSWQDAEGRVDARAWFEETRKRSNFLFMQRDAARYVPGVNEFVQHGSLWELKAVLPASEADDSRPILFLRDAGGLPGLVCVLGGKIDNVYDLEREVSELLDSAARRP